LKHGARSALAHAGELPEQAEARAAVAERERAIVSDLGGALTEIAMGQVRRHVRLELVAEAVWQNVQAIGPLSAKGRARSALNAWLQIVDRLHRSALALGLERRSRPVDPLDAVARAVIEANRTQEDQ
jgi:hypothetical protein